MDFISFPFYLFLAATVVVYYILPLRFRWFVLLVSSLSYFWIASNSYRSVAVFLGIILISWLSGLFQQHLRRKDYPLRVRKAVLAFSILIVLVPLFVARDSAVLYALESILRTNHTGVLISIGLSYFTLQIIAYLADIYRGIVEPQRNLFKYALFVSFFPQILQGPIPRYNQLEPQLIAGHKFDEKGFTKGFMLIIWGFFLKLMIADKAGIAVDTIFAEPDLYHGAYVLVAGVLYSFQLYADFLSCVTLAQGMSELFGIHLADNFNHPFFAASIKEFWERWHISLSSWLRDYIYIPLGGNRNGTARKYLNLCITFAVSGLWHGAGLKYIIWGLMHAGYQIFGSLTEQVRSRFFQRIGIPGSSRKRHWIRCATTFFLFVTSVIIFRAETLGDGLFMLKTMFTTYNPWILLDDSLLELGLEWKEWVVLILSLFLLLQVSRTQERYSICDRILAQPFYLRLMLYVCAISVIVVFGTYGVGYDAADFIYGGF